jgi:type IV pilus assembly protein PilB
MEDGLVRPNERSLSSLSELAPAPANVAVITDAIEEFFGRLDSAPDQVEAPKAREGRDAAADAAIDGVIRLLTRKEPMKPADVEAAIDRTAARALDVARSELVLVWLVGEKKKIWPFGKSGSRLVLAAAAPARALFGGKIDAEARFRERVAKVRGELALDPTKGIVGRALSKKTTIVSHDARRDPDFDDAFGKALAVETRSLLTVPITDGVEHYGAIQAVNKERGSGEEFFSQKDQAALEDVARYLGRLIRRASNPGHETSDGDMARYVAHLARTEALDLLEPDPKDPGHPKVELDEKLWDQVGWDAIKKYQILPLRALRSKAVAVVMANPLDLQRRRDFEAATDRVIAETFAATPAQIATVLERKVRSRPATAGETNKLLGDVHAAVADRVVEQREMRDFSDGPIIQLANHLIEDAHARGASDIHFEPQEKDVRIRFRVDGNLQDSMRLPKQAHEPLIARLKIMAPPMKIDERRLPQDGKIVFKNYSRSGLDLDLRVATAPATWGEKAVLRLLSKSSISLGLDSMGFSAENLQKFRWAARQPYGMVLCCGPTGSGKTTTLYSALSEVNTPDVNIQTAEDPVEYPLAGVTQVQVNPPIGLTFASALRAYMRMDPDVILVGEIRDRETADCAIEASLTGHLLLSTLHTNDAASTVTRFIEMKIEPFLIASCLLLVSAQRLARRLCSSCRVEWKPTADEKRALSLDARASEKTLHRASDTGCERCAKTGYKGRVGIHEILALEGEIGTAIRELIHDRVSSETMKAKAVALGMRTLWDDALLKVREGVTDLREVATIVRADAPASVVRPATAAGKKRVSTSSKLAAVAAKAAPARAATPRPRGR